MSGSSLASRHCVPCRGGVPPLEGEALETFARQLPDWRVVEQHHLEKSYRFPDFKTALEFVNRIGMVAEEEGHHPDLCFGWGNVQVTIFTHKIKGLTESDFILAAKVDELFLSQQQRPESNESRPPV
jgi:4a-hydroxytetrahydrobiopterin dehydratase